jgi:hypothetical protein
MIVLTEKKYSFLFNVEYLQEESTEDLASCLVAEKHSHHSAIYRNKSTAQLISALNALSSSFVF